MQDKHAKGRISFIGINESVFDSPLIQQRFLVALCTGPSHNATIVTKCSIAHRHAEGPTVVVEFEISDSKDIDKVTSEVNSHVARGGFIRAFQVSGNVSMCSLVSPFQTSVGSSASVIAYDKAEYRPFVLLTQWQLILIIVGGSVVFLAIVILVVVVQRARRAKRKRIEHELNAVRRSQPALIYLTTSNRPPLLKPHSALRLKASRATRQSR